MTTASLSVTVAPMIVLLNEPFPYFYMVGMLLLSIVFSCFIT